MHNYHQHLYRILQLGIHNHMVQLKSKTRRAKKTFLHLLLFRRTLPLSLSWTVTLSEAISVIFPRTNPCSLSRIQTGLLPFTVIIFQWCNRRLRLEYTSYVGKRQQVDNFKRFDWWTFSNKWKKNSFQWKIFFSCFFREETSFSWKKINLEIEHVDCSARCQSNDWWWARLLVWIIRLMLY